MRESGLGMGTLPVCFALAGSIRCISEWFMVCYMTVVHCGGSLANRFSVKPSFRAFVGH